ncbi:MAG TPA: choice-of-anchor tandem repeat GloVer-containing protein [Gemmataceae bacterium]|jgi:uncharacterized repeat protein (TIGR03803 family)
MSLPPSGARCALVVLAGLLPTTPASAQVVILHSFAGGVSDGQSPNGSLTLSGSTFYGMTEAGGAFGDGTVFQIGADGTGYANLHFFGSSILADGIHPFGSLSVSGPTLYGMTFGGGSAANSGTVFKLNADGTGFGLIHSFTGGAADGSVPVGSLAQSGSTFYGLTSQGGTANIGAAFRLNADGTGFGLIHSFTGPPADGQAPGFSALVPSGSTLFGMTNEGGTAGQGAVFKMNADGTGFSLLHSFDPATGDGWDPNGSLTLSGSTLYGMTKQGGGGAGAIFKMNEDGTGYGILHTFQGQSGGDGAGPLGSLLLAGSTLYGMTNVGGPANLGTVFEMNADGTGYQVLHSFLGGPGDGARPAGDLTLIGSTLYGMTGAGGTSNLGTIFAIPIPEPSALLLTAAGGVVALLAQRRRTKRTRMTAGGRG